MLGEISKVKIFMVIVISFITSGCSSIELASHYTKKLLGPSHSSYSKGNYKVGSSYKIAGKRYYPREDFYLVQTGMASWYGPNFHGKRTANGEIYNQYAMTAAHRTLQIPAFVRVDNLENGRSVVVRVNDRGPYAKGRIIDLSKAAAKRLGIIKKGTAKVRIQVLPEESKFAAKMAKNGYNTSKMDYAWVRRQLNTSSASNLAYNDININNSVRYDAKQEVAYLKSDATMDFQYIPMGKVKEPYLPESLQRPVIIRDKQQIYNNHNVSSKYNNNSSSLEKKVYIQAGAFSIYDNADRLGQKLSKLAPVDISEINVSNRKLYRVRLGPIDSVQAANILSYDIKNLGYLAPVKIIIEN